MAPQTNNRNTSTTQPKAIFSPWLNSPLLMAARSSLILGLAMTRAPFASSGPSRTKAYRLTAWNRRRWRRAAARIRVATGRRGVATSTAQLRQVRLVVDVNDAGDFDRHVERLRLLHT